MENVVHLDFETYSEADIRKTGAYRYARHPSTEVLIACYWLPGMDKDIDEPLEWLPLSQPVPADLLKAANTKSVNFYAHNAQFERAVWKWALRRQHRTLPDIRPGRWRCTAAMAAASGLPRGLDAALEALGTGARKDPEGARLIKVFCKPRKPTKANASTRIRPEDAPADFRKFVRYCKKDVIGEMELHAHLPELNEEEQRFFELDMLMNERGLPIDLSLVRTAQKVLTVLEGRIADEVAAITGGVKASQGAKLKEWLLARGLDMENLQAQTVRDVLSGHPGLDPDLQRLLALRVQASKASTKKFASMLMCADPDEQIVQGGFLYHGAHTGRYAGRLIQPQNFIRGTLKPHQQDTVFEALALADPDVMETLYEWPIDIISQCMRGFIKAPDGYRFVVVDYTAIEARVLAWVAGEAKVLAAYRKGVDVYKMMASALFGITIEEVSGEQRRLGKNLVLGCGYALGAARFVEYCANLGQEVDPAFAKKAVGMYREQHPAIVASWKVAEDAVVAAIRSPGRVVEALQCRFYVEGLWLRIQLPSGREIRYLRPRATPIERWGKPAHQISFQTDYHGKIVRETTYGGKIIENIVQGIARDVMREGMFNAEKAGYPTHGTVHDELLTIRPVGVGNHKELEAVVCKPAPWMRGIPLNAEGFETVRYRKG